MNQTNQRRNFLRNLLLTGAGALATATFVGCDKNGVDYSTNTPVDNGTDGDINEIENPNPSGLTQDQADRLFFIYQEEKVARDVYIYLGNLYPRENTFASIQKAEQRHMDSAQKLCEKYNIDISGVDESALGYGEFLVEYLQELYDKAIELGEENLLEALKVGELVEVTDIGTLTDTINGEVGEMPDDVINTYYTLREGSYNHLESYQQAILRTKER